MKLLHQDIIDRMESRRKEIGRPNSTGYISQEELSLSAGLPKSAYTSIVYSYRNVSEDEISKLAQALYCSKEYLMSGSGEIFNAPHPMTATEHFYKTLELFGITESTASDILQILKSNSKDLLAQNGFGKGEGGVSHR